MNNDMITNIIFISYLLYLCYLCAPYIKVHYIYIYQLGRYRTQIQYYLQIMPKKSKYIDMHLLDQLINKYTITFFILCTREFVLFCLFLVN
jgi:hypothetical protein